jgi:hypothetical protein
MQFPKTRLCGRFIPAASLGSFESSGFSELAASRNAFSGDDQNKHQGPKNEKTVGMQPAKAEYSLAHFMVRLCSVIRPPKVIPFALDLAVHSIASEVGSGN